MDGFSERLNKAMSIRNIKQVELVEMTGITKGAISSYVNGDYTPKQINTYKIAKALSVDPAWLMGKDVSMEPTRKRYLIPVLGRVQAGLPIEAVENIIDYEEIPEEMASGGEFFGLQIKGNSMEPRFLEGDVVIVRKQPNIETGEIGIVIVNGIDATIKRIVKHDNGISLIALNPTYPPRFYTCEEIIKLPITVLGKVVELRGKF